MMENIEMERQKALNDEVRKYIEWAKALVGLFRFMLAAGCLAIGFALYVHSKGTMGDLLVVMGCFLIYRLHKKGLI